MIGKTKGSDSLESLPFTVIRVFGLTSYQIIHDLSGIFCFVSNDL